MIAQTIQLALAPVFVLVAIGNILNILTSRLARVVDRSRELRRLHGETEDGEHDMVVVEIRIVARRISLIGRAMRLLVMSGLSIGLTVGLLFVEEMAGARLQQIAAGAFLVSVGLLMWALLLFLRETQVAAESLRIPETFLELDRKL
uniref:DUF2721 domain-containing protein n=1 Tax=Parerythrobacter lutipelagi TaxID=1964208 RepID=UPI0010F4FAAB|nr:DUF2721 domain-containing protein [Parerythrobacter lutipelagi]